MKKTKKKSAKKTVRKAGGRGPQTVTLKRAPKDGELPAQAAGICAILNAKGAVAVPELLKAMEGKIATKQTMAAIWGFYRRRLIKQGFLSVANVKGGTQ